MDSSTPPAQHGRLDLDELDATLAALGVDLDDDLDGCGADLDDSDSGLGGAGCDGWADAGQGGVRPDPVGHVDLDLGPPPRLAAPGAPVDLRDGARSTAAVPSDDLGWDPAAELPAPSAPPGYHLDARGVLRRGPRSVFVPGQRRVTLGRMFRFTERDATVLVPAMLCRLELLAWVPDVAAATADTLLGEVSVAAHPVPAAVWSRFAAHPVGVWAPELDPAHMLDTAAVAELAGLSPSSVPTYLARGVLPEPQRRVAGSPLWSVPVVAEALAGRRLPGRPPVTPHR